MLVRKLGATLALLFVVAVAAFGQESVLTLQPFDGDTTKYVDAQFAADTTNTGGLLPNRVYELQRDQIYLSRRIINIQSGETLRIRAASGSGAKPIIYLFEQGFTNPGQSQRPPGNFVQLAGGNLELRDICLVGYYEFTPDMLDEIQGGLINTNAVGSSIIIDGVIFSNINGQHVRTGSNAVKVQITNTIFANMGALTRSNLGAGKGIDLREATIDTLIVQNCTFVNYQDRAIRHYNFNNPGAGTGPIQYGIIDHNTFVNGMGFHGLMSLGNVGDEIQVTNNLFVDGFALGEDPTDSTRAAEWANTGETYPSGRNRITWIFSAPSGDSTQWRIGGNYYAITDSGQAFLDDFGYGVASPLSWHINSRLAAQGYDSAMAFQEVDLTLANTPRLMTNMMRWYEDPNGGHREKDQTNFVTERDDYDRRLIEYYRDTLDASYSTSSPAYTGAKAGYPAGDLNWFPSLKALWENDAFATGVPGSDAVPVHFTLDQNYPNPFNPSTKLTYGVPVEAKVTLEVFDVLGRRVAVILEGKKQPAGTYTVNFDATNLVSGVYFYRLTTPYNAITKKMVLLK